MSAISQILTPCPDLQYMLDDVWTAGEMIGADERMPFAQFMCSPENRQGITTAISPGGGKVRNVQVVYMQRKTEDLLNTNQPNPNCGVGEDPGDLSTTYTLNTDVNIQSDGFALDASMLEDVCRDNGRLFTELMQREMDVLRRGVATEIATQAVALSGGWADLFTTGNAVGNVNASNQFVIQTVTSGVMSTTGWNSAYNAAVDSGFGTPAMFVGTTIREYYQKSLAGCCNTNGLDIRALFDLYGFAVMHDMRIQKALGAGTYLDGANEGLVVKPGALQLVQYTRSPWKGSFGMPAEASNYYHGVISDPMTCFEYDVMMQDNCGAIKVNLTWTGKVIGMPNDMFAVGDNYEGVTYVAPGVVVNT